MVNLRTTFAGLNLKNPIIISSSGLTDSALKNKKLEDAGAGAIVLKSLFEEQIMMSASHIDTSDYPEAQDYISTYVRSHSIKEYVDLIKESKKLCSIPIIASINCYSNNEWTYFAKTMQDAGADALELNILSIETNKDGTYGEKEQHYINIVNSVKHHVSIPIIVKIGNNISNPVALVNQLYANGAKAVVIFNRTYQTDIDIENMSFTTGEIFSSQNILSERLRWTAICSAFVSNIDFAISGGVHEGKDVIKSILAGASSVEICSSLYKHGNNVIEDMKMKLDNWMKEKSYTSISQFKGVINAKAAGDINPFERIQFMKYYSSKS